MSDMSWTDEPDSLDAVEIETMLREQGERPASRIDMETGEIENGDLNDDTLDADAEAMSEPDDNELTVKAQAKHVQNLPAFDLTPKGLTVNAPITYKEWTVELNVLRQMEGAIQWWIGDCLNYGERRWGEKYAQAVNEAEAKNWQRYASVAARYEITHRCVNLSWTHHLVVAYLDEPTRDELLQRAATFQWSVRDLKAAALEARGITPGVLEPNKLVFCNEYQVYPRAFVHADGEWLLTIAIRENDVIAEQLNRNLETYQVNGLKLTLSE